MCGRYNFIIEQSEEIQEIQEQLNASFQGKKARLGEIFPTDPVPILVGAGGRISPVLGTWGFPRFDQKGVIINARAETAFEKKIFRDSLLNRRCIIPSTGFYEWDDKKKKYLLRMEGTNALYMAGLYMNYGNELRYVILTTDANESVKEIHNRMPLVIPKEEITAWITDYSMTNDFLRRVPPCLVKEVI